jgi:hypothetical protein
VAICSTSITGPPVPPAQDRREPVPPIGRHRPPERASLRAGHRRPHRPESRRRRPRCSGRPAGPLTSPPGPTCSQRRPPRPPPQAPPPRPRPAPATPPPAIPRRDGMPGSPPAISAGNCHPTAGLARNTSSRGPAAARTPRASTARVPGPFWRAGPHGGDHRPAAGGRHRRRGTPPRPTGTGPGRPSAGRPAPPRGERGQAAGEAAGEAAAEHAAHQAQRPRAHTHAIVTCPGSTRNGIQPRGRDRGLTHGPGRPPTTPPNAAEASSKAGARTADTAGNLIVSTTASFASLTGILARLASAGLCGR